MNILYIHGFASSGQASSGKLLEQYISTADRLFTPDIPVSPKEAIQFIGDYIDNNQIDIIIGTSLGGLYAKQFNIPKICINPAFEHNIIPGKYIFLNPREDNQLEFEITDNDLEYISNLSLNAKNNISEFFGLSHILIGTHDEVIDFHNMNLSDYTNSTDKIYYAEFGHRLEEKIIKSNVLNMINALKHNISTIKKYNLI